MNYSRNKIYFTLAVVVLFFPVACFHSIPDICKRDFVTVDREIDTALFEIAQSQTSTSANRSIASSKHSGISHIDEKWESWSVDQLKYNQRNMDLTGFTANGRTLRAQFSHLADDWVKFYGYSQLGDRDGMLRTLKVIRELQNQVQSSACSLESK